eukprot:g60669.t1
MYMPTLLSCPSTAIKSVEHQRRTGLARLEGASNQKMKLQAMIKSVLSPTVARGFGNCLRNLKYGIHSDTDSVSGVSSDSGSSGFASVRS